MTASFTSPGTAAQGRLLTDANLKIRKDGLAFLVGTGYTVSDTNAHLRNWLSLTVLNNGASYAGSVNADTYAEDVPQKYPSIAFSPVDGTGYIAWRTKHGAGFVTDLRVIPPSYNGTTDKNLGRQITLDYLDQPAVAVDSAGNIRLVGKTGSSAPGDPVHLQLLTLDKNLTVLSQTTLDTQGAGQREEMDPIIAIDPADNLHVVAQFPKSGETYGPVTGEFVYSQVNAGAFVKTEITPAGWRNLLGRKAKDIACAPDGTVYVAVNNTGQLDLYKRAPGAGGSEKWSKVQTNLFQIYADSVAVTVSSDGRIWAAQGDGKNSATDPAPNNGVNIRYSSDGGLHFSAVERAVITPAPTALSVALDGNGPGGLVHLVGSFQYDYDHVTTSYTRAALSGVTPPLPPVPAPPPVEPPTPETSFLPPSSVSAAALSFNQVQLYWKDKTADEVEFSVERQDAQHPWSVVGSAPANSTGWLDVIAIQPATLYTYRVRAHKTGLFSNYSLEVTATTPARPAPPPPPPPAPVADPNIIIMNDHRLGGGFLAYWRLWVQPDTIHPLGLPVSEETDYIDPAGKKFVVQAFERAVLGYDVSIADPRYRVQPLLLGWDWLKAHFPGLVKN